MPNGNFLICSGRTGWFFEIDSLEDVVWEYKIPLQQGMPVAQGTVLVPGQSVFRATKYPADHPFLVNTALPPIGYIELQPDTAFCGTIALPIAEAANGHTRAALPESIDRPGQFLLFRR